MDIKIGDAAPLASRIAESKHANRGVAKEHEEHRTYRMCTAGSVT